MHVHLHKTCLIFQVKTEDVEGDPRDHSEDNHYNENKQTFDDEQGLPDDYLAMQTFTAFPPKRNGLIPSINNKHDKSRGNSNVNKLYLQNIDEYVKDKRKDDEINSEWRDLANIMDRVFLILYCLMTLITTLAFLLQCAIQ